MRWVDSATVVLGLASIVVMVMVFLFVRRRNAVKASAGVGVVLMPTLFLVWATVSAALIFYGLH